MTLIDLNEKLGEQINIITDARTPFAERKKLCEIAMSVSSLAKQAINLADVALRTEKLISEGKLANSAVEKLVKG